MNILFVTNNYKPYSGGVVASIESFRTELEKLGHTVFIVTLDFDPALQDEPFVIRLQCPLRFMYKQNPIAIPLFIRRQLKQVFQNINPDIVHVHHPFVLGTAATEIARKKNIPVFFTHHSHYGDYAYYYAPFLKNIARSLIDYSVQSFCEKVSCIIAPTESVKKQLKLTNKKSTIEVIPSGILSVFEHTEKPQKNFVKKHFDLLTVSRFVPEKNISFLLQAMRFLDERFHLTLIGFGPELENLQKYAFEVCQLDPERISFIEHPSKSVIAHYYAQSDIFIFGSKTETQGLVFAESMAAGTPIVAFNGPGARDCIKNNENGFLVNTPEEMAEKVLLLATNQNLYKRLSNAAFAYSQHYKTTVTTEKLLSLYSKFTTPFSSEIDS